MDVRSFHVQALQQLGETCLICYNREHNSPLSCQQIPSNRQPLTEDEKIGYKERRPSLWSNIGSRSLVGHVAYPGNGNAFESKNGESFDRGHLCAAKDFHVSDVHSSYHVINRVPQDSTFNRGSWRQEEEEARTFIRNNSQGGPYCMTTSLSSFFDQTIREKGHNCVAVKIPKHFAKVICVIYQNWLQT